MKRKFNQDLEHVKKLSNEFLYMSQKGTVGFYEKAVIQDITLYFLKEGMMDIAITAAEWALATYPFSGDIAQLAGEVYHKAENLVDALHYLDKAISLDPLQTESYWLKAAIFIEMERYEQAQETLSYLQDEDLEREGEHNIYLYFASIYENLDRHEDLFDALCNALRTDWDNEEVLTRLGMCTEFCLQHDEHIEFLNEYLDERPFSSVAWFNLGHSHWYNCDYDLAAEAFEYAYLTDKHNHQAYLDHADIIKLQENYKLALYIYENGLEYWADDTDLKVGKGNCLYITGQYTEALAIFSSIQRNAEAFYGKGLCHLKLDQPELALYAFLEAVAYDDRKEEYAAALGEAYYILGNIEKAATAFNRAIELAPEISNYWVRNISFLMDQENFDAAFECIQDAFANTFGAELKYCHAAYCLRTGQRAEGISMLEEAMFEDEQLANSLANLYPNMKEDEEVMSILARRQA